MFVLLSGCTKNVEPQIKSPIEMCWFEHKAAQEFYREKILGIVPATFIDKQGKPQSYYVVTIDAMNKINERYDALVDFVICKEWEFIND